MNIILQHFDGELRELDKLSIDNIRNYADMVGAEYQLITGKPFRKHLTSPCQKVYMLDKCWDKYEDVLTDEQYDLFCTKQYDYGCGNITLGGDLDNDEDRMFALTALVIRMNDKVNRLKNIIVKHKGDNAVKDETYMDAFKDLSVYGVIAQLVSERVWGK